MDQKKAKQWIFRLLGVASAPVILLTQTNVAKAAGLADVENTGVLPSWIWVFLGLGGLALGMLIVLIESWIEKRKGETHYQAMSLLARRNPVESMFMSYKKQ